MQIWSCIKSVCDGELLLTIMSSLAQEESRSISLNVTWDQRKWFADGKASAPFSVFLGYDRGENGEFVINAEQADIYHGVNNAFKPSSATLSGREKSMRKSPARPAMFPYATPCSTG